MNIIIKPKPDKDKMITIHKKKKELTDMTIRGLFTYVHQLENKNARLEESFQRATGEIAADPLPGATVDRERFGKAAEEVFDNVKDELDRVAIADFVNQLENALFGGADDD